MNTTSTASSTILSPRQIEDLRLWTLAVTSDTTADDRMLSGWTIAAGIVAENGTGARAVYESYVPLPGKSDSSRANAWTRVSWAAKLLSVVDNIEDPNGATRITTQINYLQAEKGVAVASGVAAILKTGERFTTVVKLAEHMEALRAERNGEKKKKDKTPETYEKFVLRMASGMMAGSDTFDVELNTILKDVVATLKEKKAEQAAKAAA